MISVLDAVVVIAGGLAFFVRVADSGISLLVSSLLLFAYAGVTFFWPWSERVAHGLKTALLACLLVSTVGYQTIHAINKRHASPPPQTRFVHDHPLQIEASVDVLLKGENPYTADFRKTPMVNWWSGNPALTHVIALPVTFLKSVPFSMAWHALFGWYDDRISHLCLLALLLCALYALPRHPMLKLVSVAAVAFNPLFTNYFIEGRSDVIFLSFLISSLAMLRRGWTEVALLFLALALGSKHTAWFILPFLAVYLWRKGVFRPERQHVLVLPLFLLAAIFVPFLLWDYGAFIEDIIAYPAGTIATSYPINGYGLSRILVTLHVLPNTRAAFPIGLFAVVLVPLLALLLRHMWHKFTLGNMLLCYVAFLWPFWFVSRFFNENYMGVVAIVMTLAAIMLHDEKLNSTAGRAPRWKFWRRWEKN